MRDREIRILSHGATGRGNDQVRFQLCTNMLAPDFQVYAPWRDEVFLKRFGGRSEMIDYCLEREAADQGEQGRAVFDRREPARSDARGGQARVARDRAVVHHPGHGRAAKGRPRQAGEGDRALRDKAGRSAINGKKVNAFEAISQANEIGGRNGVGIATHLVENRFVGVKSRGVYEAPGMELLGSALRVPAATGPRPSGPRAIRPAFALPVEADLPGLRLRPGVAHGPRGTGPGGQAHDRDDHAQSLQGPCLLRRGVGRATSDVFGVERVDGGDRRVQPCRFRGIPARPSGQCPGAGGEWPGDCSGVGEVVVLEAIYQQSAPWVCLDADGAFRLVSPLPRVVFPGSFNPLHHGHTLLAERTAERLGQPVAFELSIVNVDKPNLTPDEVLRRLEQFRGRGPVFVTRAPRIEEKAALFPGCIFVVGADTAARIVHPRYYGDDPAELTGALERIRGLGCRFLVAGRADDCGRFVEVTDVAIPEVYRDLFLGFTEQQFRVDVSSTHLRQG